MQLPTPAESSGSAAGSATPASPAPQPAAQPAGQAAAQTTAQKSTGTAPKAAEQTAEAKRSRQEAARVAAAFGTQHSAVAPGGGAATQTAGHTDAKKTSAKDAEPRESRGGLWFLIVALLAGLVIAGYAGRSELVQRFPGLKPVYESLGIQAGAPGAGLEIFNVTSVRRLQDGDTVLMIEGEIRNTTSAPIDLPPMQVQIFDAESDLLASWTFEVSAKTIAAGEVGAFQTKSVNPPSDGVDTRVSFIAPEDLP